MLIISSKKDIWENHSYSKKDSFLDFDLDSELAQDDTAFAKITKKSFKKRVKGKRILLLIHGYNPDFLDVLASYSTLHQNMQQYFAKETPAYDEVIGYTWHAGGDEFNYSESKKFAALASDRLRNILNKTLAEANAIDAMTHSLGSRVLLRALALDKTGTVGKKSKQPKIRHHFCLAASVSNTCFDKGKQLRAATQQAKATWVFYSKNDASLQSDALLAKSNIPLGLTGPLGKTKDFPKRTAAIDSSNVVFTHGAYKRSPVFYAFWESVLMKDVDVRGHRFELEPRKH